jgi:hypothetical protein
MPVINFIANVLTGYKRDLAFQLTFRFFPGSKICGVESPHSKCHEESANGLVDMVYVADDINYLLKGNSLIFLPRSNALVLNCLVENDCMAEFDFDSVTDTESVVTVAIFSECISLVFDLWPKLDAWVIGRCVANTMQVNAASNDTADTIDADSYRILNGCTVFDETGVLVMESLASCLVSNATRPAVCGAFVNDHDSLALCLDGCQANGLGCAGGCLLQYTTLSQAAFQTTACLNALLASTDDDMYTLFHTACQSLGGGRKERKLSGNGNYSAAPTTVFKAFVGGLPGLVSCAASACQDEYFMEYGTQIGLVLRVRVQREQRNVRHGEDFTQTRVVCPFLPG